MRDAIDDLDSALKHFFRRVKSGKRQGKGCEFPQFEQKGVNDSFELRVKPKFDVDGRLLRIEKLPTRIAMR